MKRLKLFICYSSVDKEIAGRIAERFKKFTGFDVFLAHDDLSYSENWPKDIWENLHKAHIIMPLLSKNFKKSGFANQEIGIAIVRGKNIIPLSIDGTKSYGFIYEKQAQNCTNLNDDVLLPIISEVYFLSFKHPKFIAFNNLAMNSISYALEQSSHFKITSLAISAIIQSHKFKRFNKEQLGVIAKGCKENREVNRYVWFYKLRDFLKAEYNIAIDN